MSYDGVYPLSTPRLRRLLAAQRLESRIVVPEIPAATQALYNGLELQLVRAYNRLRGVRLVRLILLAVGPFFLRLRSKEALLRKTVGLRGLAVR